MHWLLPEGWQRLTQLGLEMTLSPPVTQLRLPFPPPRDLHVVRCQTYRLTGFYYLPLNSYANFGDYA